MTMNCRRAERGLLISFDRDLPAAAGRALAEHLERCPECRKRAEEYGLLRNRLSAGPAPEGLPRFWERLESRLAETAPAPSAVRPRLWAEAIPVSLALIAGFLLASLFLAPSVSSSSYAMTETQALLLTEDNPIVETRAIIDEGRRDVRDLTVLFAGNEIANGGK